MFKILSSFLKSDPNSPKYSLGKRVIVPRLNNPQLIRSSSDPLSVKEIKEIIETHKKKTV